MLVYEKPDSPDAWLGKEDFWLIGESTQKPIERRKTGALFGCLLYPMIDGEAVQPAQIGLSVSSRTEVGMPRNIQLAGASSVHGTARIIHMVRFEGTLDASTALMKAAGVLAVAEDADLIAELCSASSFKPVREIVPEFAARLGSYLIPQLPLE